MKTLIYSIVALTLLIFSCQKEKDLQYEAGKTKGMLITTYNTSIKADHLTGNRSVSFDLDLNSDGAVDIQFTSFQDSIQPALCGQYTEEELAEMEYEGKKFFSARTDVYVPDGIFQFSIHDNSDLSYEIISDPYIIDGPSGATLMTENTFTRTKPSFNAQSWDDYSSIQSFKEGEIVQAEQLFSKTNRTLTMRNLPYEYTVFYKDFDGSRHGLITRMERNCFEVPANEIRYILFRSISRWGWISFEITEENRITIIDVALSKK